MENSGLFSKALLEIEIQLDDLIEKSGGLEGVRLLDMLNRLPIEERQSLLNTFSAMVTAKLEGKETPKDPSEIQTFTKVSRFTLINGGRSNDLSSKTNVINQSHSIKSNSDQEPTARRNNFRR